MAGHPHQWFGGLTYAQHGDDLVVVNIFHKLGIFKPSYLDIGAFHPFDLSNTALLYERGGRGINVEANPEMLAAFQTARPDDVNINVAVSDQPGRVTLYRAGRDSGRNSTLRDAMDGLPIIDQIAIEALTVNQIVDAHASGVFPDFLSIDIEGKDADVLRACDFSRSSPKVICAEAVAGERNSGFDLEMLMFERDYTCVFKPGFNLVFVRDDLRPA